MLFMHDLCTFFHFRDTVNRIEVYLSEAIFEVFVISDRPAPIRDLEQFRSWLVGPANDPGECPVAE